MSSNQHLDAAEAALVAAAAALDAAIAAVSDPPVRFCPDCGSGCDPCDCGSDSPWQTTDDPSDDPIVAALRAPGEPVKLTAAEVRPGMRMIGGQWFYSSRWL